MSQSLNFNKIKALANSIIAYAADCEKENPFDIANSEQGKQVSKVCSELSSLIATPRNWVIQVACAYSRCTALSLVLDMGLQKFISNTEATTSLDDLTRVTNGSKQIKKTALRECVGAHIFEEPKPENYRHNENSRVLLNENYASWVHFRVDEGFTSAAHLSRSVMANGLQLPNEPRKIPLAIAFNTDKPFYQYYDSEDPVRGARFSKGMAGSLDNGTYGMPVELVYSFEKLGKAATIVDVGGGRGQNCIRLANLFPEMSFVLQDLYVNANSESLLHVPVDIRNRIKWQVHDFYDSQPVKGADLYLISQILMDHQFDACRVIMQHIVEAMNPNHSVLLISDYMSPGEEDYLSPTINALKIHIMSILGRAFWTREEWEDLSTAVSPSLKLRSLKFSSGRAVFELVRDS